MATNLQSRPWSRLASIARPVPVPVPAAAPPPPPAPVPAPPPPPPPSPPPSAAPPPPPPPAAPIPPPAMPPAPAPAPVTQPSPTQTRPIPARLPTFRPLPQASPPPPPPPPAASLPPTEPATSPVPVAVVAPPAKSPTPKPSPTPKTSPTQILLSVTTASVQTPPKPKPAQSSSSPPKPVTTLASSAPNFQAPKTGPTPSLSTSPAQRVGPTASSIFSTVRRPSPTQSSRAIKPTAQTPPDSPKPKPTGSPPSPLNLPPSQLKLERENEPKIPVVAEQKTVLVQKTVAEKPLSWLSGSEPKKDAGSTNHKTNLPVSNSKHEGTNAAESKERKGTSKKVSSDSSDEGGFRVITLAGENKGAVMEIFHSPRKNGFEGNPRYLQNQKAAGGTSKAAVVNDGGETWHSFSSGDEGYDKKKNDEKNQKASKTKRTLPMTAFMNSNVQAVNNSIMYNSKCKHHDPGLHLALSRKPGHGGLQLKESGNGSRN